MINISSNKLSIGFLLKNTFNAYYLVDIEKLMKREDTIFVFDTNVLLNLYSYTEQTREDFFSLLDIVKDRVWIPYHVGLEYQRNRLSVIRNEKKIFNDLNTYVSSIKKDLDTTLLQSLKLKQRLPKINEETINLQKKIIEELDNYSKLIDEWNKMQPCVRSVDLIRNRIDEIFDNKIGEIPKSQEYLNELYEDGKKRYENKIPPGYEDEKTKKGNNSFKYNNLEYIPMYGDYIIWEQLINEVKNKDLKSLLFITDDVKEDWLYLIDSNGKKEIGPRVELVDEIQKRTDIELFHIMKSSDFLIKGKEHFNNKIKDDSIEEINESFDIKQNYYLDNLAFSDIYGNMEIEKQKMNYEKWAKAFGREEALTPKTIQESMFEILNKREEAPTPKKIQESMFEILNQREEALTPKTIQESVFEILNKREEVLKPKTIQESVFEILNKREEVLKPKITTETLTELFRKVESQEPKTTGEELFKIWKNMEKNK